MVVPQWKASSWRCIGVLVASLTACYSPDIGEELSAWGAGGQLGTNVRRNAPPPASALPGSAASGADSAARGADDGSTARASSTEAAEKQPAVPPPGLPPLTVPPTAGPCSTCCTPRLAHPAVLPVACAGEAYFTRLQLECAEAAGTAAGEPPGVSRSAPPGAVQWRPTALPAEMTLTAGGELLGSAALSAGKHELQAQALVAGATLEVSLQLEVLDRCFLLAAAAPLEQKPEGPMATAAGAGPTRILAQRLDADVSLWLPESLPANITVQSFDLSADGRWLAVVSAGPAGQRLLLFHISAGQVAELPLQHVGAHVAHAFSPDSAHLAVVSDLTTDASLPPDARLSVLDLSGLDFSGLALAGAALVLPEAFALPYQLGLGWADPATLQFIGLSPQFPTYFTPQVVRLAAAGLAAAAPEEVLYPMDPADTIRWFRPLPGGFYVMTNALSYVNASATVAAVHLQAQALSPTYQFSAHAAGGSLLLHAPEAQDLLAPDFSAGGCDRLLAWSGDGQSLLCLFEGQLTELTLGDEGLASAHLATAWPAGGTQRSTVSQQGRWSVVADGEHGLFLLEHGAPAPSAPLIPTAPAEAGWDFAISRDERYLWVQQGRRLSLAELRGGEEAAFTLLSDSMPATAVCVESGLPLPEAWCGAPELRSPVRLRRAGRFLAFTDAAGTLALVDMAVPSRRYAPSARRATTCAEPCVEFQ